MLSSNQINEALKNDFWQLINQKTGLVVRSQDRNLWYQKILLRMKTIKIEIPEDYYFLLWQQTNASKEEWSKLISLLTNNESLFFRDKEQFNLIRHEILPNLIKHKEAEKTLRICSAGCSTGQEPYSLAIALKELIPNLNQWKILILGIDIDQLALKEAKKGIYANWSFRNTEPRIKQQYFQKIDSNYHLDTEIKKMVQFKPVNLITEPLPQTNTILRDMDLVICRNVFIYFDKKSIKSVLEKMYKLLQPSGYLITGHTELSEQNLSKFQTLVFPQSLVYQKTAKTFNEQLSKPIIYANNNYQSQFKALNVSNFTPKSQPNGKLPCQNNPSRNQLKIPHQTTNKIVNESEILKQANKLLAEEKYQVAITKIKEILNNNQQNFEAYNLLAKIYTNLSQYNQAKEYCQKALKIDNLKISPYQILAKIAEEENNLEEAKRILKQIIFLEPLSVNSYLDLSYIYQQEGNFLRMKKMKQTALNILGQLSSEKPLSEKGNIQVKKLRQKLEDEISQ